MRARDETARTTKRDFCDFIEQREARDRTRDSIIEPVRAGSASRRCKRAPVRDPVIVNYGLNQSTPQLIGPSFTRPGTVFHLRRLH